MSKLIRDASAKELNMPKYKVMGTISEDTSSLIVDLVKDNDTSGVPRIMDELTRFLGPVTNISADLYDTPVDHNMAVSRNYKDPTSVFFLNVSYNISPEFFIDNVSYNMVVFQRPLDHRTDNGRRRLAAGRHQGLMNEAARQSDGLI